MFIKYKQILLAIPVYSTSQQLLLVKAYHRFLKREEKLHHFPNKAYYENTLISFYLLKKLMSI